MSVWGWVGIGVGAFLALSLLMALVVARVLGAIGRQVSELYDAETWASAPPTRAHEPADAAPEDAKRKRDRVVRLR
jgi:hypothetical protein